MEEAAKTLAQTAVQDSHLIRNPSPTRDIAPATSADRPPIHVVRDALPSIQFSSARTDLQHLASHQQPRPHPHHRHRHHHHHHRHHRGHTAEDSEDEASDSGSEISVEESPLPSTPPKLRRRQNLPPIPDLRFEQAYLKQLEAAKGSVLWMIVITIREQVLFPGVQGFLWALGLAGLRTLRARQAENGRATGSWIRDLFGRVGKTDTTMMGTRSNGNFGR